MRKCSLIFEVSLRSLADFAHFSTSSMVIFQALNTLPEFLCQPGNSSILNCMVSIQSLNLIENDFCNNSKVTSMYDRISVGFPSNISYTYFTTMSNEYMCSNRN